MSSQTDDSLVLELSQVWFDNLTAQLLQAGRRIEGGWPGTISDARRLLSRHLMGRGRATDRDAFEASARAVYEGAKSRWLAIASRDTSD